MNDMSEKHGDQASAVRLDGRKVAYPDELRAQELRLLRARRGLDESTAAERAAIGIGLSGGGIRSATFALGFFQALARARLLSCVDYLSTVSGGGYFGGFLGMLFRRADNQNVAQVEDVLIGNEDRPQRVRRYLRENGRYLAPAGNDDLAVGATVLLRNWIAMQVVLITALLAGLLALQLATAAVLGITGFQPRWQELIADTAIDFQRYAVPSPWLVLPAMLLAFAIMPIGWSYWTLDLHKVDPRFGRLKGPVAALWIALPHFVVAGVGLVLAESGRPYAGRWLVAVAFLALATACAATFRARWVLGLPYVLMIAGLFARGSWSTDPMASIDLRQLAPGLVAFGLALSTVIAFKPGQPRGSMTAELDQDQQERHGVSAALKDVMLAMVGSLAFALIDTGARSLAAAFDTSQLATAGTGGAALSALLAGLARRGSSLLASRGDGKPRVKLPFALIAAIAAAVVVGGLLVLLDVCAGKLSGAFAQAPAPESVGIYCLVALVVLSWTLGLSRALLNRSTYHALYAARLTRAFLGASNPLRYHPGEDAHRNPTKSAATRIMPEDDMPSHAYFGWPAAQDQVEPANAYAKGAPLHLVNVTINETVDGRSQVQQTDRKGVGMALGPCGLSAGVKHHAVFDCRENGDHALAVLPAEGWRVFDLPSTTREAAGRARRWFDKSRSWIRAQLAKLRGANPEDAAKAAEAAAAREKAERFPLDRLSIGQWLAISGAAFSTGLGAQTHVALSLLAGLANIRLGYWWRHGVPRPLPLLHRLRAVFWVQGYLFRELLARFPGTANALWYLSDGGHFENLGGYELIRRRLPFMVIVNAEADPDGRSDGLANLVRKARIDFGAEIEFLERPDELFPSWPDYVGPLGDQRRGDWTNMRRVPLAWQLLVNGDGPARPSDGPERIPLLDRVDRAGLSRAHAALARVTYADPPETCWLLYVKPTLIGDEPSDLAHYHAENPAFPHEPTIDQFFGEAQWESYRKLGELIGTRLFPPQGGPLTKLLDGTHTKLRTPAQPGAPVAPPPDPTRAPNPVQPAAE